MILICTIELWAIIGLHPVEVLEKAWREAARRNKRRMYFFIGF